MLTTCHYVVCIMNPINPCNYSRSPKRLQYMNAKDYRQSDTYGSEDAYVKFTFISA